MAGTPRYTEEDVTDWRRLLDGGWTLREIEAHYGVAYNTLVRRIGARKVRTGPRQLDVSIEEVRAAIAATGSQLGAAKELGVSRTVIRHRLWQAGECDDPHGSRSAGTVD